MSAVTIAIPFANAASWLPGAIRSVFAQTFTDWELLLVDDGSTDGSLTTAKAVTDPRVCVISDGMNRGLSARLNQIAGLAQSPLLARMDADDLMHPQRLQRQIAYLSAHPETDLVCTAMAVLDGEDSVTGIRYVSPAGFNRRTALRRSILTHATVTGRTDWFRQHRYNEALDRAEDQELWFRTVGQSSFAALDEPLYFCRDHCAGVSPKYRASCRASRQILLREGPAVVGWPSTLGLVAASYSKQWIYGFAAASGREHLVQGRRNQPVSNAMRIEIERALSQIGRTPVPGFEAAEVTR
ncbi:MAG: glycosyltransferase [Bryobacterales bacterium]|nr:glycosyltransferase [Bryobacterales bacterium]